VKIELRLQNFKLDLQNVEISSHVKVDFDRNRSFLKHRHVSLKNTALFFDACAQIKMPIIGKYR
jgi:hypothetical protein